VRPSAQTIAPLLACAAACLAAGCGGQSSTTSQATAHAGSGARSATTRASGTAAVTVTSPAPPRPPSPAPIVTVPPVVGGAWTPVATVRGQTAAWIAQRGGVTLLRFEPELARLALHAGSAEPGGSGWRYADQIGPSEIHRVIAGFNGGFKLSYGSVGFFASGRTAVALHSGLASIVTYADGSTQIGAWHEGVPSRGKPIASVRQNLHLLIHPGRAAPTVETCGSECWGETLGGGTSVARSALGIDAEGRLVWAAGENLSPAQLAAAMTGVGVQRAVELDINPFWVAGYLYVHHSPGPSAVPVVPGQHGIAGELLEPYSRDFFTVLAR